jgi:hypothetical protein
MRDTYWIHVSAAVRGYMEDTCGIHEEYMRNTCISNVSGEVRISDAQDTCGIHAGYMYPQRSSRYMRDTCGIHVSQMHPERDVSDTKATCGIHAGYIRDTCGIHVSSVAIKIQSRYILDPCKIHAGYMRDTYLGGWGNVLMPSSCAAHL